MCIIGQNNNTKINKVATEVAESEDDIKLVEATKNKISKLQYKMNVREKDEKESFS